MVVYRYYIFVDVGTENWSKIVIIMTCTISAMVVGRAGVFMSHLPLDCLDPLK